MILGMLMKFCLRIMEITDLCSIFTSFFQHCKLSSPANKCYITSFPNHLKYRSCISSII